MKQELNFYSSRNIQVLRFTREKDRLVRELTEAKESKGKTDLVCGMSLDEKTVFLLF